MDVFNYETVSLIKFSLLEIAVSVCFISLAVALVFLFTYLGYDEVLKVVRNDRQDDTHSGIFIAYCYATPICIILVTAFFLVRQRGRSTASHSPTVLEETVYEEVGPLKPLDEAPDAQEQVCPM